MNDSGSSSRAGSVAVGSAGDAGVAPTVLAVSAVLLDSRLLDSSTHPSRTMATSAEALRARIQRGWMARRLTSSVDFSFWVAPRERR